MYPFLLDFIKDLSKAGEAALDKAEKDLSDALTILRSVKGKEPHADTTTRNTDR